MAFRVLISVFFVRNLGCLGVLAFVFWCSSSKRLRGYLVVFRASGLGLPFVFLSRVFSASSRGFYTGSARILYSVRLKGFEGASS